MKNIKEIPKFSKIKNSRLQSAERVRAGDLIRKSYSTPLPSSSPLITLRRLVHAGAGGLRHFHFTFIRIPNNSSNY